MKNLIVTLVLLVSLTAVKYARGNDTEPVRLWEGNITIPTYPWQTDINPKFWALEGAIKGSTTVKGSIVYPYTMQDHLSRKEQDRTYKAIFLENKYLKITCLPELGGRLHSVLDKTQNKEMFHLNRVIKPSMIAMRGAFISGGVEWNAGPQVHTVTIVSPVNVIGAKKPDGSAYLQISNLEQSLRTRWTVRLTLFPDKASLDEQISIFNPAEAMNPYYFWNCTAQPQKQSTRFIYPMTLGTDHYGKEFFTWPVHNGKDLSWLKNYEDASSIFSVECEHDFFGSYEVDEDRGTVQVADHTQLSGKKAWTWGQGEYGRVCQGNLTDEDGNYIEVQSGPLPTQSDYGMLWPREEVSWREWWYPVHGLGDGFEYATKDLAFQPKRKNGDLELRMIACGEFPDSAFSLSKDGKILLQKTLDLSPENPQILNAENVQNEPVKVTVTTPDGLLLAEFVTPLDLPKTSPPDTESLKEKPDNQLTMHEKYLKGLKLDRATRRKEAQKYYEMALEQDQGYPPALRQLAVLDFEAGLYKKAIEKLTKALERKPNEDGVCWYFLGMSYFRLEDFQQALRCGSQTAKCTGTRSLGHDLMGRAYMRLGQSLKAAEHFQKAVYYNPADTKAKNHLLLTTYANNNLESAHEMARELINQNPTNLLPRALLGLQSEQQMKRFVKESQDYIGEDDFEIIEACLTFAELGLFDEASRLLSAFCVEGRPRQQVSPLPLYYLAYFADRMEKEKTAQEYLSRASTTYKDYVFPSRPRAVEVLQYAIKSNPKDAHAHMHLGNLLGHLGRLEEAVKHWQEAVRLNADLSIAFRNLGLYSWVADELEKAEDYYQKAIAARKQDQTLYRDLAEIMIENNKRPQAIELIKTMPVAGMRRADIIIIWAQAYLDEARYDECIDLMETTPYFVNWEGSSVTWDIFNKANVQRGTQNFEQKDFAAAVRDFRAAVTYPENIGVGRPNRPQQAKEYYFIGKCLSALGKKQQAIEAWKAGAEQKQGSQKQNEYRDLCREALSEL